MGTHPSPVLRVFPVSLNHILLDNSLNNFVTGPPKPHAGHRMRTGVLLLRKVGHACGQQLEICHRQRENETQSPHPRSSASQPNQTNQTLH